MRLLGLPLFLLIAGCQTQTYSVAAGPLEAAAMAGLREAQVVVDPGRRLPCAWSWEKISETLTFSPRPISIGGYEDLWSRGGDNYQYPLRATFRDALATVFQGLVEVPREYPSEAFLFELTLTVVRVSHPGQEAIEATAEKCVLEGTLAVFKPGRIPFRSYALAATTQSPFVPRRERTVPDAFWQACSALAKQAESKVREDLPTLENSIRRDLWYCPVGPHFPVAAPQDGAETCPQNHRQRLKRYMQIIR